MTTCQAKPRANTRDLQLQAWVEHLQAEPRTVVLADYPDERVIAAAHWLSTQTAVAPVLLTSPGMPIPAGAANLAVLDIGVLTRDEQIRSTIERRLADACLPSSDIRDAWIDPLYLGAALVTLGRADACVAGATRSTADVVRAALRVIGPATQQDLITSSMLVFLPDGRLWAYGDCAVIPNPDSAQLAQIAVSTAETFRALVLQEPIVALLSYSTHGSARGAEPAKVSEAVRLLKERGVGLQLDGELQFDAAVVGSVAQIKAKSSEVAGAANVLVFPNLSAANIGLKISERLGGATSIGPLLQGLAAPMNDVSRGSDSMGIAAIALASAMQSLKSNG